jgi:hypothetical protein
MTVGFHTLRHDALTGLTDSQLARPWTSDAPSSPTLRVRRST